MSLLYWSLQATVVLATPTIPQKYKIDAALKIERMAMLGRCGMRGQKEKGILLTDRACPIRGGVLPKRRLWFGCAFLLTIGW